MNKQLFKKYTTYAGFALMAIMFLSEFTDMWVGVIYLVAFSTSAITIGAEMGKKTEWDFKEWWQMVMVVLNTFFIGAFSIGIILGIIGTI